MLIKKIKIENYGKFSDFEMDLSSGINVINEVNGWGKSTLASFIKVMFFGFDGEKNKKAEREREKFRPWQGGTYGGSIVFETGGKEYCFSRVFADKPSGDKFELRENTSKLISNDFSDKIGEELFELDSESFKKTVFIDQNCVETTSTGSINAKIGDLSGVTDDINKFEEVAQAFDSRLNAFTNRSTSERSKLENEISDLENEVRSIPNVEAVISSQQAEIDELVNALSAFKSERKNLSNELEKASRASELLSKKKQYNSILENFENRKHACEKAKNLFKKGLPDEDKLNKKIYEAESLDELALKLAENKLSESENISFNEDAPCFVSGIPSEADLNLFIDKVAKLSAAEAEYARLQFSEEEKAEYDAYTKKYTDKNVDFSQAAKLESELRSAKEQEALISSKEFVLQSMKAAPSSNSFLWLILLFLGIAVIGVGAVLYFVLSTMTGIITASIGAVICAFGIVFRSVLLNKKTESDSPEYKAMKNSIEESKQFVFQTKNNAAAFLDSMGIVYEEISACENLNKIRHEYERYLILCAKQNDLRDDELLEKISELKSSIDSFILPYAALFSSENDYSAKLQTLAFRSKIFRSVKAKKEVYTALEAEEKLKKHPVEEFINNLGFDSSIGLSKSLNDIKSFYTAYLDAYKEYKAAEAEKNKFEAENDIKEILGTLDSDYISVEDVKSSLSEIESKISDLSEDIHVVKSQMLGSMERLDNLNEMQSVLEEKKQNFDAFLERGRIIKLTKEFLEKAKTSFVGKYSKGLTAGFKKYYEMVDGKSGDEYSFDANMNLLISDHGEYKDINSYSAGSRDKINLCFRIGLIEAMYTDEKPFIVMDDPFTNLDKNRISGGKRVLDALKNDYQIIYFTCHDSRVPS